MAELWEAKWQDDGYYFEAQVRILVRDVTTKLLPLAGPPEKLLDFVIPDSNSARETEQVGDILVRGQPREPGQPRRDLFP